jgi:hypothetical protein
VVYLEFRGFGFAVRVLALVVIPVQDILPQVPKTVLLTLLVFFAGYAGVLDSLDIKAGYFDYNSCHRYQGLN